MHRRNWIKRIIAGIIGTKAIDSVAKAEDKTEDKVLSLQEFVEFMKPCFNMKRDVSMWKTNPLFCKRIEGEFSFTDKQIFKSITTNIGGFNENPIDHYRNKLRTLKFRFSGKTVRFFAASMTANVDKKGFLEVAMHGYFQEI